MNGPRSLKLSIAVALLLFNSTGISSAQGRKALIIGNGSYQNVPKLTDPLNDVDLMAGIFGKKLGFTVYPYKDLTGKRQRDAFDLFKSQITKGDEVVIFYSGHGVQVNRENYILPIDLDVELTSELIAQSLSIEELLTHAKDAGASLSVIFLDSCRTDADLLEDDTVGNSKSAFARTNQSAKAVFGRIQDVLTCYATEQGTPAFEGSGLYSLYSQALAEELIKKQPLIKTLMETRNKVFERSGGVQKAFFEGSLGAEIVWSDSDPTPIHVPTPVVALAPVFMPAPVVTPAPVYVPSRPQQPSLMVSYTGSEGVNIRDSRSISTQNLHGALFQQSEIPLKQIGDLVIDGSKTWVYVEVNGWVSTKNNSKTFLTHQGGNQWKVTWNKGVKDMVAMRTGPSTDRRLVSKLAFATVVDELESATNGDNHYILAKYSGWTVMRSISSIYVRPIY